MTDFNNYIIPGILLGSFMISLFAFPSYIKLLERKNLVDSPDHRKIHKRVVPGMGGVIIIGSMMVTVLFFFPLNQLVNLRFFIGGLFIMFIVGLRDDIVPLKPFLKLISQIVPIVIVFFFFDIRLESFYSIYSGILPIWFQLLLTVFTVVIITNSMNLIDGIDGLSGSLSLLSICAFATVFYINGDLYFSYFLISLAGAILGFMIFNWSPAKIFMGDNGALFIGFVLATSAVYFLNNPGTIIFNSTVGTAIAFISVPLFDMFRIIIIRLIGKRKLMSADRNHIHHLLLDLGLSHPRVTVILSTVQASIIIAVIIGRGLSDWIIFTMLAAILFGFNGVILLLRRRKTKTQEAGI